MLAVEPAVGRPPEPDEETAHRLWHALSARLDADKGDGLSPNAYLAVHRETGAPLRAIWNLAQRFLEYGDVYAPSEGASAAAHPPKTVIAGHHRATRG